MIGLREKYIGFKYTEREKERKKERKKERSMFPSLKQREIDR